MNASSNPTGQWALSEEVRQNIWQNNHLWNAICVLVSALNRDVPLWQCPWLLIVLLWILSARYRTEFLQSNTKVLSFVRSQAWVARSVNSVGSSGFGYSNRRPMDNLCFAQITASFFAFSRSYHTYCPIYCIILTSNQLFRITWSCRTSSGA